MKKGPAYINPSKSDIWSTPQPLFDFLNRRFRFTLDPCATDQNHKCPCYFTEKTDGLSHSWKGFRPFVNPPYSASAKWLAKGLAETKNGVTSVFLIPARVDTEYWEKYVLQAAEITFITGRLNFGEGKSNAGFPSVIVVFRPGKHRRRISWKDRGAFGLKPTKFYGKHR